MLATVFLFYKFPYIKLFLGIFIFVRGGFFLIHFSFSLFALWLFYKTLWFIHNARRLFHKARCKKHKARCLFHTTRSKKYKVRRFIHKVRCLIHKVWRLFYKARSIKHKVRRLIHKARRLFDTSLLFIETTLPLFVNLRSWFDSTFRSFDIVGSLSINRILHFLFTNIFFLVKGNHISSPCWFFYSDYSQLFRVWYSFYKIICSYISH